MLFNSAQFFAFFPLSVLGFYLCPRKWRTVYLTFVSWYFYSFWSLRFVGLIILSTTMDYWLGLQIQRAATQPVRKRFVVVSLLFNLGLLGFFKYYNFFADSAGSLLHALGKDVEPRMLSVVLPVGISFYTFQSMGYIIDVYRGVAQARRRFFDFAAYVAFYPQLVAGPISRAGHLLPEIESPRPLSWNYLAPALRLICVGLFKKMVIADNLAPLVEYVFDGRGAAPGGMGLALLGTYAFAAQIYCDFSGYTDIARGVARFFGVDIMLNFRMPYLAGSIREFWQRWHISLSTWLRDYLYISLGGSRRGPRRAALNVMITMVLGGLWHGASWMFVLWGTYQGLLILLERLLSPGGDSSPLPPWKRALRIGLTFHLVCFGWVMFRCRTVADFGRWLTMFASPGLDATFLSLAACVVFYSVPLVLLWCFQSARNLPDLLEWRRFSLRDVALIGAIVVGITVLGAEFGREFIYFQF